jgi:hypothetical protein
MQRHGVAIDGMGNALTVVGAYVVGAKPVGR